MVAAFLDLLTLSDYIIFYYIIYLFIRRKNLFFISITINFYCYPRNMSAVILRIINMKIDYKIFFDYS